MGRAARSERSLLDRLTAADGGTGATDDGPRETTHAKLVHVHLPALEAAGLIAWDRDAGTVETAAHPAFSDPRFERLLGIESAGLDDVLRALSHDFRRIVLTELRRGEGERSSSALAREVRRCRDAEGSPDPAAVEDVAVALRHVHLPKLSDLGFVAYDADRDGVRYTGGSVLETVLAVIYERDEDIVDKYDGFLSGLGDSYRPAGSGRGDPAGWPHGWGESHDG